MQRAIAAIVSSAQSGSTGRVGGLDPTEGRRLSRCDLRETTFEELER
jgi:hypothetical protein